MRKPEERVFPTKLRIPANSVRCVGGATSTGATEIGPSADRNKKAPTGGAGAEVWLHCPTAANRGHTHHIRHSGTWIRPHSDSAPK